MGAFFKLQHANVMAYVTSRSYGAPRMRRDDLTGFLKMLAYDSERYLISEVGADDWQIQIAGIARHALNRLMDTPAEADAQDMLRAAIVERLLEELRSEFSRFPLFALAVGNGEQLRQAAEWLAYRPMHGHLLVLIPEQESMEHNFHVLDPIPAFSVALHSAADWPGIVFWTPNGASAFVPLRDVDDVWHRLNSKVRIDRRARAYPGQAMAEFDSVLRTLNTSAPSSYRRLLHLSDLHFGTRHAAENQPLLNAELRDVVKSVDRVVITGDLFDTPKADYAVLFRAFRDNITHLAGGREPISITGNHDQRMIGLFGADYKQVASIGSTKIIVDDNCNMVFICFNSSVSGSFARGKITASQFRQLGAEYRTLTAARPELKEFLPIVLVHHHPFSFDVAPDTLVQRALAAIGLKEETLLELKDAELLHHWCLDWNIKTILHGHKHKARYVERNVGRGGEHMSLTAIGCGSSLGAEGSPVSYNMLEWEPKSQRWIASFFESINGGAFRETVASISPGAGGQ